MKAEIETSYENRNFCSHNFSFIVYLLGSYYLNINYYL